MQYLLVGPGFSDCDVSIRGSDPQGLSSMEHLAHEPVARYLALHGYRVIIRETPIAGGDIEISRKTFGKPQVNVSISAADQPFRVHPGSILRVDLNPPGFLATRPRRHGSIV